MRILPVCLILALLASPVSAGDAPPPARRDVWSAFAGMDDEQQAQTLELRDELIPAHLAFLSALEKAEGQLDALTVDDLRLALAWSRVEYLLETSFRLLAATNEYDAFLKATEPLRPDTPPPGPGESEARAGEAEQGPPDGGLAYADAEGRPLTVAPGEAGPVLLDAGRPRPPETLEGVVASPAEPEEEPYHAYIPLIRARAAWLRARALERVGKTDEAGAETAGLGLIRDWAVLGPLDDGADDEYSSPGYARDDGTVPYEPVVTLPGGGRMAWKAFSSADPLGRVFPGAMFRAGGPKSAVFLALVHAAADGPAVLRFGTTAAAVAGVNHVTANHNRAGGLPDPDQESAGVWMRRGWNIVLVRTAAPGAGDWSFTARLTATDGKPFPGRVMPVAQDSLPEFLAAAKEASVRSALERFYNPAHLPESGGVSIASEWLDRHPEDARGNFYLASLLVARRMMEGPERFDRELIFRRAMEHSSRDPFFTLMAARSIDSGIDGPDREENLRLVLLRSVGDLGSAAALVDIGRLYLDVMRQPRRADEYAERALSINPLSLRAGVLDYDIAVDMDWRPFAKSLLEKLVPRHPSAAAVRLRLGRDALDGGRHRQALTEFHAVLAVDAGNHEALDGAVLALGMLGQTSAATDLLKDRITRFPYDFSLRLKLADLYRTLGRDADADEVLALALDIAPDDPAALAMRGNIRRESAAAGPPPRPAMDEHRQELDLSPAAVPPPNGWEYLYFQIEDAMEAGGGIQRNVSFAVRIHTENAARMLRHLALWLDGDLEKSRVTRLELIEADGSRTRVTPPRQTGGGDALRFYLPPLRSGMAVEAEVEILREPAPFLGEYFGHIAPLAQLAPVRLSRYMFSAPKDRRVYFRPVNGAPEAMVVESADGGTVTRIWEMSNLPAFVPEPYSPGQGDLAPGVQVSAFGDWDEFARWYWRLIGAQYHAPPELRLLANRMAEGGGTPMAKLDRAAEWISRNIVRRQWEYGPYAFRPVNARSILSRLTADGKDRTLLLCLLAREYGLDAWPVLGRFRDGRAQPPGSGALDLPLLDHFNYSLSLVRPGLGGDVLMDAANPHRPPGVMPPRLSDSPGIAVTPLGAERIHIPDAGVLACEWAGEGDLLVDSDGSILWEEKVDAAGAAAERLRAMFPADGDAEAAWDEFLRSFGGDPSTSTGVFSPLPAEPNRAAWQGRGRLRRFAAMEDDKVVLAVPPLAAGGGYPLNLSDMASPGERGQDAVLPYGFRVFRRITVRYPAGWRLVNQSPPFSREYPFADVSLSWDSKPGEATLTFEAEMPGHRVAAKDFAAFRELAAVMARWTRPELVWEKP